MLFWQATYLLLVSTTTITDIYTNQNKANFIPPNQNFKLSSDVIKSVEDEIYSKITIAVDRMKTDSKNIKAIVVRGGSFIIPKKLYLTQNTY